MTVRPEKHVMYWFNGPEEVGRDVVERRRAFGVLLLVWQREAQLFNPLMLRAYNKMTSYLLQEPN